MSSITLKTEKRATSVSSQKIREAVSAAYVKKSEGTKAGSVVVRVTKKASLKTTTS
jgi:hypothetical protein